MNLVEKLKSLHESVLLNVNYNPQNTIDSTEVVDKMNDILYNNTQAYTLPYDLNSEDFELDTFQVSLEDNLAQYGVLSVNVEVGDDKDIYFDLEFKENQTLTFRMFVDATSKPKIECIYTEDRGKEDFLPSSFADSHGIYLSLDNIRFMPYEFIISCIHTYITNIQLNESLVKNVIRTYNPQPLMEVRFRKVIRDGQPQWVKLKKLKRRRKLLSFAQKMAIRLAQRRAHTSTAERNRAKSLLKGDRFNLYDKKQIRSSVPVKR